MYITVCHSPRPAAVAVMGRETATAEHIQTATHGHCNFGVFCSAFVPHFRASAPGGPTGESRRLGLRLTLGFELTFDGELERQVLKQASKITEPVLGLNLFAIENSFI